MQIGSLVVVKKIDKSLEGIVDISWWPIDDGETIYTVRKIFTSEDGSIGAYFEEAIMGYFEGVEVGLNSTYIIEVQPPMKIEIEKYFKN